MTPFTNDDLKRLKETFDRVVKDGFMIWASKPTVRSDANEIFDSIPALLARLEAAENVCEMTYHGFASWDALDVAREAWRKARGK